MNTKTPLACNMGVFTARQREAHIQNTTELIQAVRNVQEVENGYQFIFPNEFVSNEQLCCPFLRFTLTVDASEPISLLLTGPFGTQEFLRAEFAGAFS
jgi:hypothetical protein